jgi:arabinofuranosyltransferase
MVGSWAARVSPGAVLAVWVPVLVFAVLAWQHRWVSDDGYINLRIVWNMVHGHGPVFNPGERVEAGTSPLWLVVLAVARLPLWFLDPGWSAVVVGIACTLAGLAFAAVGARRWWASLGRTAPLPLGAAVLVALAPMWDFASSGLETGLGFGWIGACWWATARRLGGREQEYQVQDYDEYQEPLTVDRPWWAPVLIGSGLLVRPDFLLFAVAFAVAFAVTSSWTRRQAARALALGLALPVAYQVFRMGYFGLLVPNTALTKEAGRNLWDRGWNYLDVYLSSTLLLVPLALLLVVFVLEAAPSGATRRHVIVAAAPVVAALVHTLYVVRVGGDFMYARLFLPATFAVLCPVAALPVPGLRRPAWVAVVPLCAVLVVIGVDRRWDPMIINDDPATPQVDGDLSIDGIANERAVYALLAGTDTPVTYDDFRVHVEYPLQELGELPREGALIDLGGSQRVARSDEPMLVAGSIGLVGYKFLGTHVIDQLSLADSIGAHMEAGEAGRPGHEKILSWEWLIARFALPSADDGFVVEQARIALSCGELEELVDAVEDPLTPGRFLRNLVGAVDRTRLRIPHDPAVARAEFC